MRGVEAELGFTLGESILPGTMSVLCCWCLWPAASLPAEQPPPRWPLSILLTFLLTVSGGIAGSALPARPRQADPYSSSEVWDAISTIELSLEVCASRFTCKVPLAVTVADFGNNHAVVRGTPIDKSCLFNISPMVRFAALAPRCSHSRVALIADVLAG